MVKKNLEDIAAQAISSGTPDAIQEAVDDTVKLAGKKLWHGLARAAAGGFGKGVLLAAGLLIVAGALFGGLQAYAAGAAIEAGLAGGAKIMAAFLTGTPAGWSALGIGGALGSVMDMRKHHNRLSAHAAEAQKLAYEKMRERQQAVNLEKQRGHFTDPVSPPAFSHAARELERRHQTNPGMAK